MGRDGMADRSSRPHRSPTKTLSSTVRKIVHLCWKKRLGPVGVGARLGMPASTVHAVLTSCHLNRLHHVDVRTGDPVRTYEHEQPGDLIHVDVKKLGNIRQWRRLAVRRQAPGRPEQGRHPEQSPQ